MSGGHHHHHSSANIARLGPAVGLTLAFVAGEILAGYFAHSVALLSDAGHNFADAAALGFSWYAAGVARKPSNEAMTFGYHRLGILAALINSMLLVLIAVGIFLSALWRLWHPVEPIGSLMLGVALAAVVVNLLITFWLSSGRHDNINIRSAYLHMLGDAISAFGVVVAGVMVMIYHWSTADAVVSFLIAGLILFSSVGILRESLNDLLEGTPMGLDMQGVQQCIAAVPGVLGVHDLHVWTVGPGAVACSCHILVAEQSVREGQQILKAVTNELHQHFGIHHTTVQVEVEGHESNEMYCSIHAHEHDA